MKLIDANILIYAFDATSPQHDRARSWLEAQLAEGQLLGLAWPTVMAFVRIVTNRRLFVPPANIDEAVDRVTELLAYPGVTLLEPTSRHWAILSGLMGEAKAVGPLVMDAELAALAIEHGATIHSSDRDFRLFRGVEVRNPLLPT